jgi:AraC-like DNA-binding protein
LYDLDVSGDLPDSCRVVAWRPPVPGIAEVFHARIVDYRYPTHCHDTWTVLIVDAGALHYDLDTRHHQNGAAEGAVSVLPPGAAHNGQPTDRLTGFRKRNLYLDADFLPTDLADAAVTGSTFFDPRLRAAIAHLHERLTDPDPLDVESRLALLAERLHTRLRRRAAPPRTPEPILADRLRDYLNASLTGSVRLADAGRSFDRSVPHLVRSFRQRFGITPYAYVTGARIERARAMLLAGMAPAQVAVEVGFHDQAHLTRHFTRHVAVPPARYAASAAAGRGGVGGANLPTRSGYLPRIA